MSGVLVLSGGVVSSPQGGHLTLPEPWSLDDLVTPANRVRPVASTVLVLDDSGWDHAVDERRHTVTGSQSAEPWRYQVQPMNGEAPLNVVMLEHDAGGHFAGPFDAIEVPDLLVALWRLHELLGVWWADSVGRTMERLILDTHPKARGGTQLDRKPFCPDPVAVPSLELDLQSWRRPLIPAERQARFVHVYDANAQHLSALAGVEVGHGVPLHLSDGVKFDARQTGFWHYPGGFDGLHTPGHELLPPPWLPDRDWYATATVTRMLEVTVGMDVPDLAEAWVWPKRSRFLRGAAERLRDARSLARQVKGHTDARLGSGDPTALHDRIVADVVLEAVKMLYQRQAGRLGMQRDSSWYRPDWGHEVRATARVNMHRRLGHLTRRPFAIATDAFAIASDARGPVEFAGAIGLPIGVGMGEYRVVSTSMFDDGAGWLDDDMHADLNGAALIRALTP